MADRDDHVRHPRREDPVALLEVVRHALGAEPRLLDGAIGEADGEIVVPHAVEIERLHLEHHRVFLAQHRAQTNAVSVATGRMVVVCGQRGWVHAVHSWGSRVSLAAVAASLIVVPAPRAVAAPARVPGIDVSMWQGDVDWAAVASTPTRFAIMRATRGHDYVDPRYAEYLAEGSASGLVVGAYHRAKVSLAAGDARAEANHFVDVAQIEAGDVLPVLDIEEHGGLTVPQLTDWVRTWLARVFTRTGVRAMIYASPHFWRTYLGDTTWFADHGYPLWIAHWGVQSPNVPAANWGGHGWTFWQWTSTGSVSGISTNVDRDRFNGAGLLRGKIASLTVTPAAGGVITGARIACGGAAIACNRLANPDTVLTLAATPDPGASFLRWTGACAAVGSTPTCDVTALGAKTVSAVFTYPVNVELQGTGDGTVSSTPAGIECGATCTASFPVGATVDLAADADSASAFVGWGGGCARHRLRPAR